MDEMFSQDPSALLGSDVVRRIRKNEKERRAAGEEWLPAAIVSCTGNLSAHTEALERTRMLDCGADALWSKPTPSFANGTMQRLLAELLSNRASTPAGS